MIRCVQLNSSENALDSKIDIQIRVSLSSSGEGFSDNFVTLCVICSFLRQMDPKLVYLPGFLAFTKASNDILLDFLY